MVMKLNFEGLMAPVFTPFSADGKTLVLKSISTYAEFLVKNGVRGALVNGTTGEGMSLTAAERMATAEAWVSASAKTGIHVMVHVGGTNLQDVLELARHAEKIGAHSLLCLPELFNKPASVEELVDYLSIVASAAPKTPFLYYHNPAASAVSVNVPALLSLAGERIKTFAGVKFTDTNLEMGVKCLEVQGGAFSVFLGCDHVMAGAFALGFNSTIATCLNMFPRQIVRILESVQRSEVGDAREAQNSLNAYSAAITKAGKWVPTMKAAMHLITGMNMGPSRAPLCTPTDEQIQTMRTDLKALKLL